MVTEREDRARMVPGNNNWRAINTIHQNSRREQLLEVRKHHNPTTDPTAYAAIEDLVHNIHSAAGTMMLHLYRPHYKTHDRVYP